MRAPTPHRRRRRGELLRLATQPTAALRVLAMVEDPGCSSRDLAQLVEADPALSAKVIAMANSPYYGVARRVSSVQQSVVLLGFTTMRGLAVSSACGLLSRQQRAPRGLWRHSIDIAAGASTIAAHAGLPTADAMSSGLLHDIGLLLFWRRSSEMCDEVLDATDRGIGARTAVELRRFGETHSDAGADALHSWGFPAFFVDAVRTHHGLGSGPANPLARVLMAAQALATWVDLTTAADEGRPGDDATFEQADVELHTSLTAVGIAARDRDRIARSYRDQADLLVATLELAEGQR